MYLASHTFKRFEHVIYNNYNGVIKMPFLMLCCLCSFCQVSCPPWSGLGLAWLGFFGRVSIVYD